MRRPRHYVPLWAAVFGGLLILFASSLDVTNAAWDWTPQPGKYLLVFCVHGQLSNQVSCLRKSLHMARILNRGLLVPEWGASCVEGEMSQLYRWTTVVDFDRMQACLSPIYGPHAVLTVPQHLQLHNVSKVVVPEVSCIQGWQIVSGYAYCYGTGKAINLGDSFIENCVANARTISLPMRITDVHLSPFKQPRHGYNQVFSNQHLARVFGALEDDVLVLGDLLFLQLHPIPPLRVAPQCPPGSLWRPHGAIVEFAEGIAHTLLLNGAYAAVHLRRGDMYKYLRFVINLQGPKLHRGYVPAVEMAHRILETTLSQGLRAVYMASNGRDFELKLVRDVIEGNSTSGDGKRIRVLSLRDVFRNQTWLHAQPWAQPFLRLHASEGPMGVSLLLVEKLVCVRARVFLSSWISTFSKDIEKLRREEGQDLSPDKDLSASS